MASDEDILQEISDEKLIELQEVYKTDWPSSIYVYYFIDTTIKIKKQKPNEKIIRIYCPDGDISDGTIIATIEMECYDVFLYTVDPNLTRLEQALRHTKRIDYSKNPLFCALHESFYKMVSKVRNEIGHPFPYDVPSYVWWIPKEKILQYDCKIPDNVYIAPLNDTHVDEMNAVWPHKNPGSEKYISKLLKLNGGIGLFSKTNNELCAWVLKNYFGGLGILQTADNHKRKGYGSLIAKVFSKKIAQEDGYDITGFIVRTNFPSQKMFTKLGFEKIIPVTWLEHY